MGFDCAPLAVGPQPLCGGSETLDTHHIRSLGMQIYIYIYRNE